MIQASELRIGNWVSMHPTDGNLSKYDIRDNRDIHGNYLPIPLTPEIMKSCGFVHDIDNEVYRLEDFIIKDDFTSLYCPGEKGSMEKSFFVNCQYLHQLQNLYFALEYEELEIKL